jgi:hypothetical protein
LPFRFASSTSELGWSGNRPPSQQLEVAVSHQHSAVSLMLVMIVSMLPIEAFWLIAEG